MPAMPAHKIIDCIRDIHHGLAARYRELSSAAGHERLKLLFADVARREDRFAAAIDEFERTATQDVLDTWLQFVPDDAVLPARAQVDDLQADSVEEAVEQIQQVDRTLGEAYAEVAGETECRHLCEFFQNLATLEENNDRHLSKLMLGE